MSKQGLVYQVNQKPPFGKNLIFAFQQFLAIIAATILVPVLADKTGVYLSQSAALLGAGVGTIIYLLLTKFKSPVFLGSSFAFIFPLSIAVAYGYLGIFLGAVFAGLVYLLLALIVKVAGTNWITKLMPPVVIGPTVALIGLSLSGSAMNNVMNTAGGPAGYNLVSILIGIVTFLITIIVSVKGKKGLRLFPFVIGVLGGYVLAVILTLIGKAANVSYLQLVSFEPFAKIADIKEWLPNLTFLGIFKEGASKLDGFAGVVSIFVTFAPVALVVFAEHIADHKNISTIIGTDLLKDPGL
ncbi:MAG: uracil-xanthine permease, partial [Clostridia bacterium]|nr:uracil-xanthine permease [Clostridia bacterium]